MKVEVRIAAGSGLCNGETETISLWKGITGCFWDFGCGLGIILELFGAGLLCVPGVWGGFDGEALVWKGMVDDITGGGEQCE